MRDPVSVRVGTAGWSIAARYREQLPPGGSHLERYARVFPATEIDTSFQRHHRRATYARWAQSVGDDFRFAVKIPKALTHQGALALGPCPVRARFLAEVAGLGEKLAVLLVQLPPALVFDGPAARSFFTQLQQEMPAVSIACEPRHASWGAAAVDALLRELQISRVAADPARWHTDAQPGGDLRLAYFRLHGSPRTYYSNYSTAQLEALRRRLDGAACASERVWCIFDNTAHGHAIDNALCVQRALHQSV